MKNIDQYKIEPTLSIRQAITLMDEGRLMFCVCVDEKDNVIGVISDGDFRRAVHDGIQLDENVTKILNRNFISVGKSYTPKEIEDIFNNTLVRRVPVIEKGKLMDIIVAENFYKEKKDKQARDMDNPVVIMAGGEGTRLDPFTRILPKPLIPLGNEPIIKVIMDEFYKFGMDDFYISLNDKEKMVMGYFHDHDLGYQIKYLHETQPLGTAGALKQLEGKMKDTFFVSNCDIIIRADYGAFYDFHKNGQYALTMVGSMRQYTIPYGVCDIENGGTLKSMQEKPQYDLLVNTGLYLLEPNVLECIPQNESFNMTALIRKLQKNQLSVGVFPVSEKSWIDVGQLSEYKEMVRKLSLSV